MTVLAIAITKVVAEPKPIALSSLFETPIKGHMPKKYAKTKLLVIVDAIKINIIFFMLKTFSNFNPKTHRKHARKNNFIS
ncbi:hypothetical protein OMAG_001230 [Candidatus Omnitrophus magneticus]|uniref:Uncharacterized protein n=1 Tax=Candidatus Omnitrophus magneticus TaxID=1609969 RepID=A0A0F0CNK2_9BACT|nr:hypothetical protein OMAG_001230 [Candidatus Omnitrophus magneticus]